MSTPLIHTTPLQNGTAHYVRFDSVTDFHGFVDHQIRHLTPENSKIFQSVHQRTISAVHQNSEWYGTPGVSSMDEIIHHDHFLGMPLMEKIRPKLRTLLERYIVMVEDQTFPKPKLEYNDKGLGVFSFDRAATGLYRMQPTLSHTDMHKNISQMQIELDRDNKTTTIKNVFAHIKDSAASLPSLQLYITAGANANIQGDQLLYIGLACAELVEFMELRGIAVEVNVLFETFCKGSYPMGVVRLKQFGAPLDKNQLLLLSSDPRYFRYRGFKALIALSNYFGLSIPPGLGIAKPDVGKEFVNALGLGGVVFEQSYSMDAAVDEVIKIITIYTQKLKNR